MDNETVEKCSVRIAKGLSARGMKQSELCEITNIPKSAMSQYISGSFEPKQDRILLISQALDVDPAWLMGFDVPMERDKKSSPDELQLSEGERVLLDLFNKVPQEQQQLVLQMIRAALGSQE